jgi:2-polyprenyl-3-methyl-5-hydroxy-6-metoxy-1,4-benzoquinol methylase
VTEHPSDTTVAARLLRLLGTVDDLTSSSDELAAHCVDWLTSYHLSPARANVIRALDLPVSSAVLELGAGAGAVTRHLGETFSSVDAWEIDPDLAAVASARCADLPSTVVRAGWLDDIPAGATYDVVVALDVLGDLDRHGDDLASLVRRCCALLTPDGVLVLAADNADGVRYLAGEATPRLRDVSSSRPSSATRD